MDWWQTFVGSENAIWRTAVIGVCAYFALVAVLRLFGKRTLSKWSAFDLVVTVALGSGLASALVSPNVSFLQGVIAFLVLGSLQFAVSWLSIRYSWVRRFSRSQPRLLLWRGELRHAALRRERVTEAEIRATLRARGIASVSDVAAVVLETDGNLSVIPKVEDAEHSTLVDVAGLESPGPR